MDEEFEFDFGDFGVQPTAAPRLSVSALRDYRRCPTYYWHKRIDRKQEKMTHHAPAGNLVHSSWYLAYAQPVLEHNTGSGRRKLSWQLTGEFSPQDSLAMFDALWWREPEDELSDSQSMDKLNEDLQLPYVLLSEDLNHVDNFSKGQTKALKADNQRELRAGWHQHFRRMLEESLAKPVSLPIKEIEREVSFKLGDIDIKAYIDVVMDQAGVGEIGMDLKSGQQKPSPAELFFDDQIQTYYLGTGVAEFWLYHMKSGEIFSIDRNEPLIASLAEMANQDALAIQNGYFPKRFDKQICSRCPFRKDCHGV